MSENGTISTVHGKIAYWDQPARGEESGVPVVFVHGNSATKEFFTRQREGAFSENHRLIALDLPGHGASDNPPDPVRTYGIDGFADACLACLKGLGVSRAVLVGWSLGGHIVLEMAAEWPGVAGVVILGTPPIGGSAEDVAAAFLPSPLMELTFKPDFSESDARTYAQATLGEGLPLEPWMVDGAVRADGKFRGLMMEATMAGRGHDQKEIVATLSVPVAVLHGCDDPFINADYLKQLTYRNLWRGKVQEMEGVGHASFWQDSARFNRLLSEYLDAVR